MPCYTRMKTLFLRGLLWLYLLGIGCVVLSMEPGFLDFDNLPDTNFSCVGKVIGGYYADLETNCQMFHVCTIGQLDEPMDIRFLCLNGTVFDQETRVCERIDEVDCSKSEKFYSLNLELYGNTQPSIAEENAETDPPIIIKASTTTTTTTTTQKPKTKTTKASFFTTAQPTVTTVTKVISAHHFPISNSPDIRFNPEEINISLNPGSAPHVRSKSVAYQQQVFNGNDNKKVVVTTHTSYGTPEKEDFVRVVPNTQRPALSSTPKVKPQSPATPADINYGFTYHQTDGGNQDYTETPHNYQYHHSNLPFRHGQFRNQFKTTTYRTEHLPTTRKHPYIPKEPTTFRTPYVSSLKTPTYHTYRTQKPQRLQLPIPLLPTLPPLTFSSPAPFTLGNHIETKRYTNEHQTPPRIIISASASVSDNSGRRLNYSLGTIGVTPLLEEPPKSYDDYKDHDVVLDPFYHDVPKIKNSRKKRQTDSADQAAVDVLKFLFDWYQNHQKTSTVKVPINPEDITEINQELAAIVEAPLSENSKTKAEQENPPNFKDSALFNRKSKFNIIGDILSVTETSQVVSTVGPTPVTASKLDTVDYVDDNYEAVVQVNNSQLKEKNDGVETDKLRPKKEDTELTTEKEVTEVTLPPTTTTTEPTTTSRIMAIMRSRARAHHKRIMNENRRKYTSFLSNIKPKIRSRGKPRSTTEAETVVVSSTERQLEIASSTTEVTDPPLLTTATASARKTSTTQQPETDKQIISNVEDRNQGPLNVRNAEDRKFEETQDFGASHHESQVVEVSEKPTTLPELLLKETDQAREASQIAGRTEFQLTTSEPETVQKETDSFYKETADKNPLAPSLLQNEDLNLLQQTEVESTTNPVIDNTEDFNTQVIDTPQESLSPNETNPVEPDLETISEEVAEDNLNNKHQQINSTEKSENKELLITSTDITQKEFTETEGKGSILENNHETEDIVEVANETSELPKRESEATEQTLTTPTTQDSNVNDSEVNSETTFSNFEEYSNGIDATTTIQPINLVSEYDLPSTDDKAVTTSNIEEASTIPTSETTNDISVYDRTLINEENTVKVLAQETSTSSSTTEYYQETTTNDDSSITESSTTEDSQSIAEVDTTEPNLTPAEITTTETNIPRARNSRRRTRPPRYRSSPNYRRPSSRHRFSTEITSRPSRRKPVVEEEVVDALTNRLTTTETLTREEVYSTSPKLPTTTAVDYSEDVPATDAPLFKSANPTQAESSKESLHTTPLSMLYKLHVRKEKLRSYIFNCFGKPINKFYSDPRDCRLFHYCTSGYTKNQLLDMKFVCDLGTFFDEEKLICTKTRPERCL